MRVMKIMEKPDTAANKLDMLMQMSSHENLVEYFTSFEVALSNPPGSSVVCSIREFCQVDGIFIFKIINLNIFLDSLEIKTFLNFLFKKIVRN